MSSSTLGVESVSIVVVNYNAGEMLVECVRAGLEQARQVIVVDNASSDDSLKVLTTSFPAESRLCVIPAGRNLGFAAACNIGINVATEKHILLLNPDCIMDKGSLHGMVQVLESDSHIGMVGGLLTNLDGTEQAGGRRAVPTPWRSFVRAFGLSKLENRYPKLFSDFLLYRQPLPDHPIEVEAISGACMLVTRQALMDVGLLDERYFLHCEDLDWCMRFRQKEWKVMFVPAAHVLHHLGICGRSQPIFVEWNKHKGMIRFYHKFFRHQYPGILFWVVSASVWLRFALLAFYYGMLNIRRKFEK